MRTREEMKRRERVELQKHVLDQRLRQDETERWRQAAGRVAITALPLMGEAAGRALVRNAAHRGGGGCCGCLALLGALLAALAALIGIV